MNFYRRIVSIFLLTALLVSTGFGCQGTPAAQQAAIKPVVLEYWTVFDDVDAIEAQIAKFKADRPYITVNLRQLSQDEFYPRLLEALSEDRGPDIISVHNRSMSELQTKLAAMPAAVNDTIVRIEKTTFGQNTVVTTQAVPLPSVSQIDREYVQAVKGDVVMNNKIYGLPLSLDTLALYYNKDLLDRAGIPEPPKTWEEFQAAVKKLTKFDKQTGKIIQAGAALGTGNNIPGFDDLLFTLFRQSEVNFSSRDGQAIFNQLPEGVNTNEDTPAMKVVNFFSDYANPTRDTYTWNADMDNALDKFVNGSLAFFFGYSYNLAQIKARAPQLNFRILPLLQINQEKPINAADYWVQAVTLKSKKQNEAWDLVNYLTHSAAAKAYLDQTGRPTALRAYVADQMTNEDLKPFASQVLVAENWYHGKDYAATQKALASLLDEWLKAPEDVSRLQQYRQDVLNRAVAKINQTL